MPSALSLGGAVPGTVTPWRARHPARGQGHQRPLCVHKQVVADYLWHLSTHVKRRLRDLPWAVGGGGDGPRRQAPLHDIAW